MLAAKIANIVIMVRKVSRKLASGNREKMKTKFALSLLVVASLAACTNVRRTSRTSGMDKAGRYASATEVAPPAEGPGYDIPAEGPRDVNANPAYMPTPLLRASAAGGP